MELTTPDGSLKVAWYVWRTNHDIFDADTYWRVDVAHAETGQVLASRSYNHGVARSDGHESGAGIAGCSVSDDSSTLNIRLSDGRVETLDLRAIERHPRSDTSADGAHGLRWTPVEPGGTEVTVYRLPYYNQERTILVPPDPTNTPVRRVGFSGHPGLVAVVRESGEMHHLRYPHRSTTRALDWAEKHPEGRFWFRGGTAPMGPHGDEDEHRTAVAVYDDMTREVVALIVEGHAKRLDRIALREGFGLDLIFDDGTVSERSIVDGLLPFGALSASPDGTRLLRTFTCVDSLGSGEPEYVLWTQIEVIALADACTLGSVTMTCAFDKEKWGTLRMSELYPLPEGDHERVACPVERVAFGNEDGEIVVTLDDGSERRVRLPA